MKLSVMFLLLCMLSISYAQGQELRKLNENELNKENAKFTENFGRNFLTALKNNTAYVFAGEATDVIEKQMTPENQKLLYKQLMDGFGDFVSLAYAETWKMNDGTQDFYIYRLQAVFNKTDQKMEFRVVLDKADKIAGLWVAPWKESLSQ